MSDVYGLTVPVFLKSLRAIESWIDKAVAHAGEKKFDPEILMQARLAPDQYPFVRQVPAACDQAKYAAAYLAGKDAPSHPDTERTIASCAQRIATVHGVPRASRPRRLRGRRAAQVLAHLDAAASGSAGTTTCAEIAIPNFFFHVDDGVRDPAPQRRRARQDGLHRQPHARLDPRDRALTAAAARGARPRFAPGSRRAAALGRRERWCRRSPARWGRR